MAPLLPLRQKQIPRLSQCYISHTDRDLQSKDTEQNSVKCLDRLKQCINHEAYNLSMALLTIYSIFAIDIEKAGFGQQSAYIFGYIHVVAIMIFLIEMTLNSIGKQGYRCSFYFWIDLISTISMVMEITWVDNYLAANSNLPAILTIAKVVKASRLSRIGSRAAKIIFLFLEYFKNKKEQKEKLRLQNNNTQSANGDSAQKTQSVIQSKNKDQIENVFEEEDGHHSQIVNQIPQKHEYERKVLQPIQEEKVSDKSQLEKGQLEDKTAGLAYGNSLIRTKQNVLQPVLGKIRSKTNHLTQSVNTKKKPGKSKTFDMSNIVQRMQQTFKLAPLERPNVDPLKQKQVQREWREICQRELQENKQGKQKIKSDKQNFKLGQILKQRIQKNIIIMIMSLIIILPLISADIWFNKDPTIDQLMKNYMELASSLNDSAANSFLKDIIYTAQNGSYPVLNIEFPTNTTILEYPGNLMPSLNNAPPLSDFMGVQIINASLDDYKLIFNSRNIDETNALINIARSCFITILLIFSTIIFMHSIESKALVPLQNMCKSINKISINPFDALKQFNQKDDKDIEIVCKNDLQTNKLERAIWKMTKIVALGAGETGSQLISTKIDTMSLDASYVDSEGSKIHGVFLYIRITDFQENCKKNQQKLFAYINGITKNLHEIAMSNAGIILQSNPPYFLFYWKTPQDLHIQHETTKYYVANNPFKNLGKTLQTQKIIQIVLRTYLKMSVSLVQSSSKKSEDFHHQELYQTYTMQVGIHLGDAFQGSVGNKYKIQVKCLGEDIDYVKRLSFLAEKYHLSNLLSYQVYDILDDPTQNYVRKIDYVKQRKQDEPSWLCTFDFTLIPLIQPKSFKKNKESARKRKNILRKTQKLLKVFQDKNYVYKKRSEILEKINSEPIDTLLPYSRVQKYCTNSYDSTFYNNWNEAIQRYYVNEWDYASILFQNINLNLQNGYKDPISCLFLKRIERHGGEAPKQWQKAVVLDDLD